MQRPIGERIKELREEIASIRNANQLYIQAGKKVLDAAEQERRIQRLQEILDELMSLTDWKKPRIAEHRVQRTNPPGASHRWC